MASTRPDATNPADPAAANPATPGPGRMSAADATGLTYEHCAGVAAVPEADWTRLFPDEGEGWAYYVAIEGAPPPGFRFEAAVVRRSGRIIAAAPVFHVTYRLDTPLQGRWRPLGDWLFRKLPRLVSLPVMGLGSPLADRCHLGFDPGLTLEERAAALRCLLDGLDAKAAADRIPLLAIKDLADREVAPLQAVIETAGFSRIASLPVCVLELPYKTEAEYVQSLSANNRSTLRRKLKAAPKVQMETVQSIAGLEQEIFDLYEETRKNSRFDYGDFEQLSPAYFRRVMEGLGPRAACILCRVDGRLLAFKLMFIEKDRIIDKFWGMRYPIGRDYNLFFLAWMEGIRFALAHGAGRFQSGQTAYAQKVKLGSGLDKLWVYFRHRGGITNRIFRTFAPLIAFDKMDPELAEIRQREKERAAGTALMGVSKTGANKTAAGGVPPKPVGFGGWALFLALATFTQIAFKWGGTDLEKAETVGAWLAALVNSPAVGLAVLGYIVMFGVWLDILQRTSLARAFVMTGLVYVTVPLAAWAIFSEAIGVLHAAGILLIIAGIALMGPAATAEGDTGTSTTKASPDRRRDN